MRIILRPLGKVSGDVAQELSERVNRVFRCPVDVKPGSSWPDRTYDPNRRQYLSSGLLASLNLPPREKHERTVGIVDVDLYVPRLSFVFGQADVASGTAIVSLCRLRQEYYGLAPDRALLMDRATKEIAHELGHTFGLKHCSDARCVMHFSNCLADTDHKELNFCSHCHPKMFALT
jgi:archaemetzincin